MRMIWLYLNNITIDSYSGLTNYFEYDRMNYKILGGIEMNKLYWVSLIMQCQSTKQPWLCAIQSGFSSLDEAKRQIEFSRKHDKVYSAWINTYEEGGSEIIEFHECYVNAIGTVKY